MISKWEKIMENALLGEIFGERGQNTTKILQNEIFVCFGQKGILVFTPDESFNMYYVCFEVL